jgi:uncharacterized membrane protein
MQISKKVPFDNENVLNGVRALYVISNLIIAGIYLYVQAQINKKNGASNKTRELRLYSDAFYHREVGSANTPQT